MLRVLRKAMVRLPAVQGGDGGDDVFISADLKKALQAAQKLQKKKGDSFLGARVGGLGGAVGRGWVLPCWGLFHWGHWRTESRYNLPCPLKQAPTCYSWPSWTPRRWPPRWQRRA